MSRFFVLSLNGLTQGAIYAAMALALVMIWRATQVINFAQGAMAMFTTYLALFAIDHGVPYWLAFLVALSSGLILGAIVERVIVRPVESAPPLNVVILTLGLLLFLEALAPMLFGGQIRSFPPAFPILPWAASWPSWSFSSCSSKKRTWACACAPRPSTPMSRDFSASGWDGCSPWDGRSPRWWVRSLAC